MAFVGVSLGTAGMIAAGVSAGGSILSAFGASKNAKAQKKAARAARAAEEALYTRQSKNLDELVSDKNEKLYNLGGIFDRFESTGAFGDTKTLENLRKAQDDFSLLAAGDFSGFNEQLKKSLNDALVSTNQSGAPIGTFAGLAADTQMQYRKEGIQTATGLSDFFANQASSLLGLEFGIMDQKFNTGYQMDRSRVTGVNAFNQQAASQSGVGLVAAGNALGQIGSSAFKALSFGKTMGGGSGDSGKSYLSGFTGFDTDTPTRYEQTGFSPNSTRSFSGSSAPAIPLPQSGFVDDMGYSLDGGYGLLPPISNNRVQSNPFTSNYNYSNPYNSYNATNSLSSLGQRIAGT